MNILMIYATVALSVNALSDHAASIFADEDESAFFKDIIGREARAKALRWGADGSAQSTVGASAGGRSASNPAGSKLHSRREVKSPAVVQIMQQRHARTLAAADELGAEALELRTSTHLSSYLHEHDHALVSMLEVSAGMQHLGASTAATLEDSKFGASAELRAGQYFELIEDPLLNLLVPIIIKVVISMSRQPIMMVLCQLLAILLANLLATPLAEGLFPGLGLQMPGAGGSTALMSSMSPLARQAMAAFSSLTTTTTGSETTSSTQSVPVFLMQTGNSEVEQFAKARESSLGSAWHNMSWNHGDQRLDGATLRSYGAVPIPSSYDSAKLMQSSDIVSIAPSMVAKQFLREASRRMQLQSTQGRTGRAPGENRTLQQQQQDQSGRVSQAAGSERDIDSLFASVAADGSSTARPASGRPDLLSASGTVRTFSPPSVLLQVGETVHASAGIRLASTSGATLQSQLISRSRSSASFGGCGSRKHRDACIDSPLPDGSTCSWCEATVAARGGEQSEDEKGKGKDAEAQIQTSARIGRCVMCQGAWGSHDYDPSWRHAQWAGAIANDAKTPAPAILLQSQWESLDSYRSSQSVPGLESDHSERAMLAELSLPAPFSGIDRSVQAPGGNNTLGRPDRLVSYSYLQSGAQANGGQQGAVGGLRGGPAIPAEVARLTTAKGLEALKAPDGSGKQLWQCTPKPTGDHACRYGLRPAPPEPRTAIDEDATKLSKSMGSTNDPGLRGPPGFIRWNEWGPVDADPPPEPFLAEPIQPKNSLTQRVSAATIEAGGSQIVGAVLSSTSGRFRRALRSRISRRLLESVTPTLVSDVLGRVTPAVTKGVRARFVKQAAARLTRTAMVAASPAIAAAITSALGRSPAQDYFCALCESQGTKVAEFSTFGDTPIGGAKPPKEGGATNSGDQGGKTEDSKGSQIGKGMPGTYHDPGQLDGAYCGLCEQAQQDTADAARAAWQHALQAARDLALRYTDRLQQGGGLGSATASANSGSAGPMSDYARSDRRGSDAADWLDGHATRPTDELSAALHANAQASTAGQSPAQAARDAARAAVLAMARDRGIAALEKAGVGNGDSASRLGAKDGGVATAIAKSEQLGSQLDAAFNKHADEIVVRQSEEEDKASLPKVGPEKQLVRFRASGDWLESRAAGKASSNLEATKQFFKNQTIYVWVGPLGLHEGPRDVETSRL